MGRRKTPGLFKRGQYWHIDKRVCGIRFQEGTGTDSLEEAERYLNKRIEEIRHAQVYGVRPKRTFLEAATKYLAENQHKATIETDAIHLTMLADYIGHLALGQIHNVNLELFIKARLAQGKKKKTINLALQVVRRIVNLAAHEWRDSFGLSWLDKAPRIKMLKVDDARPAYPLSWEEQDRFFAKLPVHLREMALFKVNTGCREQEVCQLRWEWEIPVPELQTSVFVIPAKTVKNREPRLVVLNDIAKSVIENRRGKHPEYVFVFCYRGKWGPLTVMNNTAWDRVRNHKEVNLPYARVHDLKHTFGHRLRSAGVGFEDRQDLLGHKSHRITTHYSNSALKNLIDAANKVCDRSHQTSLLTLLKYQLEREKGHSYNSPTADRKIA